MTITRVACEKKLEHPRCPGQRKEDRPKHLSTIDTLRSITHFTRAAQNPRFPNPNPGCLEIPNPGRVSQRKTTQEGPGSALFWAESRLYIPVLFWRRLDNETRTGSQGYVLSANVGATVFFRMPLGKRLGNLGKGIILSSVLYSRYFHPLRPTFPPIPPPHRGAPPHPERTGPLWIHPRPTRPVVPSQPPVHAARAGKLRPGNYGPPWFVDVADENQ